MNLRFSLSDLSVFCEIADAGSFSRAAEALSLSIPAVSSRIKNLEEAFGLVLFERSNQGAVLTSAGRRLLEHSLELLEKANWLDEDMRSYEQGLKGLIRIAGNTTATTEFLPQRLAVFLKKFPLIDISLTVHDRAEVVKRVREGRADIGVFNHLVPASGLDVFPFAKDRLTLIVGTTHAWAAKQSMTFAQTLIAPYICLPSDEPQYLFLRQQARDIGFRLKDRIHVPSFDAMAALVAHNVGVAVMPASAALRLSRLVAVKPVELSDHWADNDLSLCTNPHEDLPARTWLLVDHLLAHSGHHCSELL